MSERRRVVVSFDPKERRTKQEFGDDVNINTIVEKYMRLGEIPAQNQARVQAYYGDVSDVGSFQEMIESYHEAQDTFMLLPAEIRARFSNNPAELVEFLSNEENEKEAIELGLIVDPEAPTTPLNVGGREDTENLLKQLEERDARIAELEKTQTEGE